MLRGRFQALYNIGSHLPFTIYLVSGYTQNLVDFWQLFLCLPKRCIPTATATTAGGTALQLLTTDFMTVGDILQTGVIA